MTRRLLLVALAACGHSASHAVEAVTVAPRPVAAPPIVVEGEASRGTEDGVAPLEIAIGADAICVRLDGRVHCDVDAPADAPVAAWPTLPGIEDAISLSVARTTGCAATRSGAVFCFGDNGSGQLGAGLRDERKDEPVRVAGITTARKVLAGDAHACAVLADATVRCWGENRNGETGGTTSYAAAARELVTPSVVPGLTDVVDVALTYGSTCARTRTGDVHCWGSSLSPEQQKARGANDENPSASRPSRRPRTSPAAAGPTAPCARTASRASARATRSARTTRCTARRRYGSADRMHAR